MVEKDKLCITGLQPSRALRRASRRHVNDPADGANANDGNGDKDKGDNENGNDETKPKAEMAEDIDLDVLAVGLNLGRSHLQKCSRGK